MKSGNHVVIVVEHFWVEIGLPDTRPDEHVSRLHYIDEGNLLHIQKQDIAGIDTLGLVKLTKITDNSTFSLVVNWYVFIVRWNWRCR